MDLAIHILTAACLVGAGVALVFLYKLVYQLEIIIERMNRRIDAMKDYEETFSDLVKRLEATQKKEVETENVVRSIVHQRLIEALNKNRLNVVDKPLDFPNDSAK